MVHISLQLQTASINISKLLLSNSTVNSSWKLFFARSCYFIVVILITIVDRPCKLDLQRLLEKRSVDSAAIDHNSTSSYWVTYNQKLTERGGSVVRHETRIREVPGSNPGADQPDWDFFVVFLNHQGKCWVGLSLPRSIWPLFIKFIYHKINSVNLTIETLTTHQ